MPRPTRIIGQIDERGGRDVFRYIVQPKRFAIFPPLHACHESRTLWLKHYDRPPRYVNLPVQPEEVGEDEDAYRRVRFDVPFISYETDIFAWLISRGRGTPGYVAGFEPFLGLDCSRIRHAGLLAMCMWPFFYAAVWRLFNRRLFPSLEVLSLIALGPDPNVDGPGRLPPWQPTLLIIQQRPFEFELRDLSPTQLALHPFFNESEFWMGQPVDRFFVLVKTLAWHFVHREMGDEEDDVLEVLADLLPPYMSEPEDQPCPLQLEGCGPGDGHGWKDITEWVPPYQIDFKFFCETGWLVELEEVGMFDDEMTRSRNFSAFQMRRIVSLPVDEGGYWRWEGAPET